MGEAEPQGTESEGFLRVLLVDDDPDMRGLLEAMLEEDGRFGVIGHASNGTEAIRLAESEHPDVVVLDLQMPGMDGLTALPLLRKCLPDSRIVVVSAFPDPLTLADAMVHGVDGYLDKTRTWCELLPTLAGLFALA